MFTNASGSCWINLQFNLFWMCWVLLMLAVLVVDEVEKKNFGR
jgi:hypothetical protein